jgi:hypothetical protein
VADVQYGPYPGYDPIAITVGSSNNTYVLWRHTSGSISLWKVDGNLNLISYQTYGPYTGWRADSLSSGNGELRLIWRYTTGDVSVWDVDAASLNYVNSRVDGPFFGFDPGTP